jgi:hypothetical protein
MIGLPQCRCSGDDSRLFCGSQKVLRIGKALGRTLVLRPRMGKFSQVWCEDAKNSP